jgi:hypothetical protein
MAINAGIQQGRSRRDREWSRFAGIKQCNNIEDFRSMARRRLPGPIFHYIDGAADDEVSIGEILKPMSGAIWCPTFSRASKASTCR